MWQNHLFISFRGWALALAMYNHSSLDTVFEWVLSPKLIVSFHMSGIIMIHCLMFVLFSSLNAAERVATAMR